MHMAARWGPGHHETYFLSFSDIDYDAGVRRGRGRMGDAARRVNPLSTNVQRGYAGLGLWA